MHQVIACEPAHYLRAKGVGRCREPAHYLRAKGVGRCGSLLII